MKQEAGPKWKSGLYPRVVGLAWNDVDEAVRRIHLSTRVLRATGSFKVVHGESVVARLLTWLLRMPEAAEAVEVRLEVIPYQHGEKWVRAFGKKRLVTTQSEGPKGILVERVGILEFRFRLEVANGALRYCQKAAGLCFGPVYMPLPRWMAPEVTAREEPSGRFNQSSVLVAVYIPLVGLLLKYSGHIEVKETL